MADKNKSFDELTHPQLQDPDSIRVRFEGYLGKTKDKQRFRLYAALGDRSTYIEFNVENAVPEKLDDGRVAIELEPDAEVVQVTGNTSTPARFLSGPVSAMMSSREAVAAGVLPTGNGVITDYTSCPSCVTRANTHCYTCRSDCGFPTHNLCEAYAARVTSPTACGPAATHCSTCYAGCVPHTTWPCNVTNYPTCVLC